MTEKVSIVQDSHQRVAFDLLNIHLESFSGTDRCEIGRDVNKLIDLYSQFYFVALTGKTRKEAKK